MKIYLSSTFEDLREHREVVATSLRSMGHDLLGMEEYTAQDIRPLARCLEDVRGSDVVVLLIGWRYGFVAEDAVNRKTKRSITELEYQEALQHDVAVLPFLLDPLAPWAPRHMDAFGDGGGAKIAAFRARVAGDKVASIFTTPDNLARQVTAAVAAKGLSRKMTHRVLDRASVVAPLRRFGQGEPGLLDTAIDTIVHMIREAREDPALPIELRLPGGWWSTRLYLIAALTERLTDVRQFVFTEDGRFAGMASPAAVRQALGDAFPRLTTFHGMMDAAQRAAPPAAPLAGAPNDDITRETHRWAQQWNRDFQDESQLKVDVRRTLLERWLGERLQTRCIEAAAELTMFDVQQIVDSMSPDVPIERPPAQQAESADPTAREIVIVSRDAFSVALAREWVRTQLPRAPVA